MDILKENFLKRPLTKEEGSLTKDGATLSEILCTVLTRVYLPNIEPSDAIQRLEEFKSAAQHNTIHFKQNSLLVTASIGATTQGKNKLEEMLAKADELLYNAKNLGRNFNPQN